MLSTEARRLLRIPKNAVLPVSLGELYDRWFAGRSYKTRFGGWKFEARGASQDGLYDLCLEHPTAQFNFGLDPECRVYVECENWIPIASSFISLVEEDAFLVASGVRKDRVRGLGRFSDYNQFLLQHRDYLARFREVTLDPEFTRAFQGAESIIMASRFYSDEHVIFCYEYFFGDGHDRTD